jgi:uncharacterized integral membrane protein
MARTPQEPDETDGGDGTREPGPEAAPRTPVTQQIGRVVVLVLLVLFVVFALDNAQRVDFSWVFGATEVREDTVGEVSGGVPLIVLLVLSFAVGAAVGALGVRMSGRARRRREADDEE